MLPLTFWKSPQIHTCKGKHLGIAPQLHRKNRECSLGLDCESAPSILSDTCPTTFLHHSPIICLSYRWTWAWLDVENTATTIAVLTRSVPELKPHCSVLSARTEYGNDGDNKVNRTTKATRRVHVHPNVVRLVKVTKLPLDFQRNMLYLLAGYTCQSTKRSCWHCLQIHCLAQKVNPNGRLHAQTNLWFKSAWFPQRP